MFKLLLFFCLLSTPVLYEGRYRPPQTVPEEAAYTPLEVENYDTLAGTIYLQAEGKALRYPTSNQLKAELFLFTVPFKWLLIGTYLLAILLAYWNYLAGWGCLCIGFILHTLSLLLRCYVLMRPPVANMSDTILYVPWIAVLVGLLSFKKKSILFSSALTAVILLMFLPMQPSLDPAPAVLDSQYWLIIHVLMVVGSYGILIVAGVYAHLLLIAKNPSQEFEKKLLKLMYLGTALLIGGTILGGVWAAQSWGRFWDWDPKEAWAFISSGIYLMGLHAYRFKKINGHGLAAGSIVGLMSITFTWYGVNYILGTGLHSYGFGNGGEGFYYLYLLGEVVFLCVSFVKIKLYKKGKIEKKDRCR